MERQLFIGSICLSDIPRDVMKKVMCKDGRERIYLNVSLVPRKEVSQFGHTHFISCQPKKEDRVDGVNYIIGDMKPLETIQPVTPETIEAAPPVSSDDDLPF